MSASSGQTKGRARRLRGGGRLARDARAAARRWAGAILEVSAGLRTPLQAAQAVGVSLPRYYQVEAAGLQGLLLACEPKPRGRQANPLTEVTVLRKQTERLQRDLARQQSLVRLAQRAVGLSAPTKVAKVGGKRRPRKPVARALTVAARLRAEAGHAGSGVAVSSAEFGR